MENISGEQRSEQGEQTPTQTTRPRPQPTAEQLARFAAADHKTKQKRKAQEPFALGVEAPTRRTQAPPQSSGIHNQRFLPPASPGMQQQEQTTISGNQHFQSQASAATLPTNPGQNLREEIRKELELVHKSNLAKRTAEVEAVWRAKRDERTKEVENYWKGKLEEAISQRTDDKMRELSEEIEKLKGRLEKGPALIKAAEERGRRQGELDGYNKLSLNPELKPSQDRLNFDFLMKEKDKQLADMMMARTNWFSDTKKYSEEMSAKLREKDQEIMRLLAQIQVQPPQQSMGQENTDALMAEGQALQAKFENQAQDLVSLQRSCSQQANIIANLTTQLNENSQESRNSEQQLGIRSAELSVMSEELKKATKEVSSLRRESDHKSAELNESNGEMAKKSEEIEKLREGRHHDSEKLSNYKRQVESQAKEIARIQSSHSDSEASNQEKDRKIASLRELLDNSKSRQSASSNQERVGRLEKQLAESQALLQVERSENASLRDQQARSEPEHLPAEPENLPTEPERGAAKVDAELVRAVLEQEREKIETGNSRRDLRVNVTLEGLEGTERERRQMLTDELQRNDAELYDARKKIRELEERLLVSSSTQPVQYLASPPLSSPPPQPSTQYSPPTLPTPPAVVPRSWFQRSRFPAPRSLLIGILIFLLAFFVPYLQSMANTALQNELVVLRSRDDRIRWEAWELAKRERNEGVPSYEEGWRRVEEVGSIGDWGR